MKIIRNLKKKIEKKEEEINNDDSIEKDLEMLSDLKNQGIINEEEFQMKKKKILGL